MVGFVDLDRGRAFTFGRNDKYQLGDGTNEPRDDPFEIEIEGETFVDGATGRGHTLLLTTSGKIYAAGDNKCWQALGADIKDKKAFEVVTVLKDIKAVSVACGAEFSMCIDDAGQVHAWGSPQYGQLGDGSDHQYIASTNRSLYYPQGPSMIKGFEHKITQVVCGANHSHCLDDQGSVYSWGFAGFGRLGLNHSPPKDIMVPQKLAGFVERNNPAKKLAAGPACGMVIDSILY